MKDQWSINYYQKEAVKTLSRDLGFDLQHVAQYNINKLQDRARRGKISGDGDER